MLTQAPATLAIMRRALRQAEQPMSYRRIVDGSSGTPYSWNMEVHLPQQQEAQLRALASQTGRGTDDLVREAVSQLLAYNEWFQTQVQIGIDQVARGEFIDEEEMDARVERLLRS